jgi:hypothetical protein
VLQPDAASAALPQAECSAACCGATAGRAQATAGEAAGCLGSDPLLISPAPSQALLLLPLLLPEAPGLLLLVAVLLSLSAGEQACRTRSSSPRTDQRLADVMRTSATLPISPGTGSSSTCRRTVSRHQVGSGRRERAERRACNVTSSGLPDSAGHTDQQPAARTWQ